MKLILLLAMALIGPARSAFQLRAATSKNLDGVISLLLKMMSDFRGQMMSDKDSWEGYQAWSEEQETDKTSYMQEQEALVMSQNGLLNANRQQVASLTEAIGKLGGDISSTIASVDELTMLRRQEHQQHEAEMADLTKTIDAVNKAIEILEGHYAANEATLSEIKKRVQYAMSLTGTNVQMLQQKAGGPDWLGVDGSKYNKFEAQKGGGGVLGTLNDLRSTLDQNKQESIEKENEQRRVYEETKGAKEGELSRMRGELAEKSLSKTQASSTITSAQATINEATKNAADAQAYIALVQSDRTKFQSEFQQRSLMRNDEMAATQAALDALQAVSAGAKGGVGLLQGTKKQAGLVQTGRKCTQCESQAKKLMALSKKLGDTPALLEVATDLSQRANGFYDEKSFEPVKELLRTLIERLEEEASAESSHHDWCETEKNSAITGKADREKTIKALQTEVEFLTTNVAQLKTELDFLSGEIDRVKDETQKGTENRNAAHEAFVKAKSDHDEVIAALQKATAALAGQYGLVQLKKTQRAVAVSHHKAKVADSPFGDYAGGAGGSAIEMIEDLLGRYSTARTQLVNDEDTAAMAYKQMMATNKQFLRDTKNTFNSKMSERRGKLNRMKDAKDQLKISFTELQEIATYLQDLRPSCDDIRSSFEERKRRREAEISALKECLEVLSDPSALGL